jgi:hypothetical protein
MAFDSQIKQGMKLPLEKCQQSVIPRFVCTILITPSRLKVCEIRMEFAEDGSISPIKMT